MSVERDSYLIHSVFCDLKQIVKVFDVILSDTDCADFMSWRFPSQKSINVDVLKILNDVSTASQEYYILLLELVVDRVHFALNIFIQNIDQRRRIKKPRNVYKPNNVSLSAVLAMFWQRTKTAEEANTSTKPANESVVTEVPSKSISSMELLPAATQTEERSLRSCESCDVASKIIKDLLVEIEQIAKKHTVRSAITRERAYMKENIYNITQWAAMNRWMHAISQDLKSLLSLFDESVTRNQCLEGENNDLLAKYNKLDAKLELIKIQTRKMQVKLDVTLQIKKDLELKNVKLMEKLENLQIKFAESQNSVQNYSKALEQVDSEQQQHIAEVREFHQKQVKELERENVRVQELYDSLLAENTDLMMTFENMKRDSDETKAYLEYRLEQESQKCANENEQRQSLNNEFTLFQENSSKQFEDLKITYEKNLSLENEKLESLEKELQQCKDQQTKLLQFPDTTNMAPSKRSMKGNPIEDMQAQIEANNLRIDLLQVENEKISVTLNKLRQFNLTAIFSPIAPPPV